MLAGLPTIYGSVDFRRNGPARQGLAPDYRISAQLPRVWRARGRLPLGRNRLTGSGRSSNIGPAGGKVPAGGKSPHRDGMADLFRTVLVARNLHLTDFLHIFREISQD